MTLRCLKRRRKLISERLLELPKVRFLKSEPPKKESVRRMRSLRAGSALEQLKSKRDEYTPTKRRRKRTFHQQRRLRYKFEKRKWIQTDVLLNRKPWWKSKTQQEVRNWVDLPTHITLCIFKKLGVMDLINAQMVCSSWREISKEPCLFTHVDLSNPIEYFSCSWHFEGIVEEIMERSCGQMAEICVKKFTTADVVRTISLQAPSLKYLKLRVETPLILIRYAKGFRQLEHLNFGDFWPIKVALMIEEVGRSCTNLKHLQLYLRAGSVSLAEEEGYDIDDSALAIAKYMPQLQQNIHLCNNTLGTKGLQAIVEGCTRLTYIHLQNCSNINMHDRDWLRDSAILRNKIINVTTWDEASENFEFDLWTKV